MPFVKGQSGNPSGRPKKVNEIKALALAACPAAIKELIKLSKDSNKSIRLSATKELLDRGIGKAAQAVEVSGDLQIHVNVREKVRDDS